MACGDPKAAFRVAILDPALTVSQPRQVTAIAGYDAISHAVESFVTAKRTPISDLFAGDAWRLLEAHYERVLADPNDLVARGAMLLGAHEAGIAIEQSMLGATHACANPLTAHHGTTHGVAIAVMLPHVVRWNAEHVEGRYRNLLDMSGVRLQPDLHREAADRLAARLEDLRRAGDLPETLGEIGVPRESLPALAADAAKQWTGIVQPAAVRRGCGVEALRAGALDMRFALLPLRATSGGADTHRGAVTALGVGLAGGMWAVIDAAVLRPLPHRDADALVFVMEMHPQRGLMAVPPANFLDWSVTRQGTPRRGR